MEYQILGQVAVTRDGIPLKFRPKAKGLLVLLLLSPDCTASQRTIREHLWPGDVWKADWLHRQVADLRKELGRELPDANSGSYRLLVSREQIDYFRFEDRLLAAARLSGAERASAFAAALREWKDNPFPSAEGKWFEEKREELIAKWKNTCLAHLEAELGAGAVSNVVAAAHQAIEKWPQDLRFSEFLLRATYNHESAVNFEETYQKCFRVVTPCSPSTIGLPRSSPAHRLSGTAGLAMGSASPPTTSNWAAG